MDRCEVRLRIRVARPMARGRKRLSVGPSSAWTSRMRSSSPTSSWLCSALATADSSSLLQALAAPRGVNARIARASLTSLPRMWSHTRRALRADVRTYLAWARTVTPAGAGVRRRVGAAGSVSSVPLRRRKRERRGDACASSAPASAGGSSPAALRGVLAGHGDRLVVGRRDGRDVGLGDKVRADRGGVVVARRGLRLFVARGGEGVGRRPLHAGRLGRGALGGRRAALRGGRLGLLGRRARGLLLGDRGVLRRLHVLVRLARLRVLGILGAHRTRPLESWPR